MRRYFSFFLCVFVLAACSTLKYSEEHAAGTFTQETAKDSVDYRKLIESAVREELQKRLELQEWIQQTTVTESLSAPDSTGQQHVTERTTTTLSKHSEATAVSSYIKNENNQERIDSAAVHAADSLDITEETDKVSKEAKKDMPWYVYAVALLGAVLMGLIFGLIIKKK